MRRFKDRTEAGKQLAKKLMNYANRDNVIVLALPRGGVPIGYEVAHALNAPLDVVLVQKLGVPGREELAMGAIASHDAKFVNDSIVRGMKISQDTVDNVIEKETRELKKREALYESARPDIDITGYTAIIVDDGLATGATMRATVQALRSQSFDKIVIAVPTAPADIIDEFQHEVNDVVCLITPQEFGGVGRWYTEFSQTTNDEVIDYLHDQPKAG